MLSLSGVLKVAQFNEQWGEGENTFSPEWHANNPVSPHELPALPATTAETHDQVVSLILGYVVDPQSGAFRLVRYNTREEFDADPNRIRQ